MSTQFEFWTVKDGGSNCYVEVRDPEGWYDADIRWDGCTNLRQYFNLPLDEPTRDEDDVDGMHICDLDEMIERLQALRRTAVAYFVGKHERLQWPED